MAGNPSLRSITAAAALAGIAASNAGAQDVQVKDLSPPGSVPDSAAVQSQSAPVVTSDSPPPQVQVTARGGVLAGSLMSDGNIDHPGIMYSYENGGKLSRNWAGVGGTEQPNFVQLVNVQGHIATRETFEVILHYDSNTKLYSADVRQLAEQEHGGDILKLSSSSSKVWQTPDGVSHVGMVEFKSRGDKILDLTSGQSLTDDDNKLLDKERKAISFAFDTIVRNLTNGEGGPPVGGINPDYRAVIPLPNGSGVIAQVGNKTYLVHPETIDQIGSSDSRYLHMELSPTGMRLEKIDNFIAALFKKDPLPLSLGVDVKSVRVDNFSGPHNDYHSAWYDPRGQQYETRDPGRREATGPGGQREIPDALKPDIISGLIAARMATRFTNSFFEPGLRTSLVDGFDGRPDCPPGSKESPGLIAQQQAAAAKAQPAASPGLKPASPKF